MGMKWLPSDFVPYGEEKERLEARGRTKKRFEQFNFSEIREIGSCAGRDGDFNNVIRGSGMGGGGGVSQKKKRKKKFKKKELGGKPC